MTEVSLTTITEDTENESTAAYLSTLHNHKDYCKRMRLKERVATESVVILGSYFIVTFGSFIVLQYFMPVGFYLVRSGFKYNTLLLIQLLLLLNSTLNPLVHYWRNQKVRQRVNSLLHELCRYVFNGPLAAATKRNSGVKNVSKEFDRRDHVRSK